MGDNESTKTITITGDKDMLEKGIPVNIKDAIKTSFTKDEPKPEKSRLWEIINKMKVSPDDFSTCPLNFTGTKAYQELKSAAEVYVMAECKIVADGSEVKVDDRDPINVSNDPNFIKDVNYNEQEVQRLAYLALIKGKLGQPMDPDEQACYTEIVNNKLSNPLLMELIWSYWHEEAMLVQAMNAICLRFQNKRSGNRDQLANMNIDPLRPLSNIIWGYIQDEPNRLSVQRRAYEYDYQYGLKLCGKAINLQSVESRSKFISAFNNLLHLCTVFFKQEDDQMVTADGFPILNALKDIQILLTQGMHNQYGDLPSTARVEMLIQQWILGRPEMKEFLGGRTMVPYPEKWMGHLDAIKSIQGWTDVPSVHFYHLANYGEKLLLSIRFGNWSAINDRDEAANWARFWRSEIQGYIYAYKAATGADVTTANPAMNEMPSQLLLKKAA